MEKVKCKYIFKDDYNPKYINGAQGGINPQGEIVVNFYFERSALPKAHIFKVDDGKLDTSNIETEPEDLNNSFIRIIENGVIMNYSTAKSIYQWLGDHLEKLEDINENENR